MKGYTEEDQEKQEILVICLKLPFIFYYNRLSMQKSVIVRDINMEGLPNWHLKSALSDCIYQNEKNRDKTLQGEIYRQDIELLANGSEYK